MKRQQEAFFLFTLKDVKLISQLRSTYGDDIILYDDNEQSVVYKLLTEFQLGDQGYAVVKQDQPVIGEPEVFRVTTGPDGELELETIDDDDEWENVTELYDEMTFSEDSAL
ncbi:DUF1292 domain-containing protein [Paenibacillus sp. FSL H7-0331]|uniref:DUF1292 domain-containing protein n=1 Tax=Paenibacillus baimaensis TaxID=2982185 RepID=A0ABT2UBU7_9BACL|nr:DUF1292 domain-containing protein [Paenibacillus sp. FSL H7-0331]MCU6791501.1 DUF1292 domain-containing protein [Paenibacillus sp. WQ 127069]